MPHRMRDGVRLVYAEAGAGGPPLVFVHGWCCDHTYFAPQVAHFRPHHRVVALDLRGYGRSDAPTQAYTIPSFADDVAWLCGELGLARPVLVGHSMGGAVVLDVAARYPDLAAAVVLLDAGLLLPPELVASLQPFARSLSTPGYLDSLRSYAERFFLPTDPPAVKATFLASVAAVPQHVLSSTYTNWLAFDSASVAAACRAPALAVASAHPVTDLNHLRQLIPQLVTGQTVGSGHFIPLIVPAQVNAMLDRFLATNLSSNEPGNRPPMHPPPPYLRRRV